MDVFEKQLAEGVDIDFDFTAWKDARPDMTITGHTLSVTAGLTLVSNLRSGSVVKVIVSGGVKFGRYKIVCLMQGSGGLSKELECVLVVRDD